MRRVFIQPHGKVRLGKSKLFLRLQEQHRQFVVGIIAVRIHTADGDIESDRESCEILCAVAVAQIDDLVELQPEAFRQFQCLCFIHQAAFEIFPVVFDQIAVHASR